MKRPAHACAEQRGPCLAADIGPLARSMDPLADHGTPEQLIGNPVEPAVGIKSAFIAVARMVLVWIRRIAATQPVIRPAYRRLLDTAGETSAARDDERLLDSP